MSLRKAQAGFLVALLAVVVTLTLAAAPGIGKSAVLARTAFSPAGVLGEVSVSAPGPEGLLSEVTVVADGPQQAVETVEVLARAGDAARGRMPEVEVLAARPGDLARVDGSRFRYN